MDAAYFWQKAVKCLRLAQTLSADNPGRLSLLEMAVGFDRRAKEIEAASVVRSEAQAKTDEPELGAAATNFVQRLIAASRRH